MNMHAIGLVIINEKDEILILDHNKFNIKTVPVGKIEEGESIYNALHREIKEEIGIEFSNEILLADSYVKYENIERSFEYVFVVNAKNIKGKPKNMEPEKHSDMYWVPINKLSEIGRLGTATHIFMECIDKGYVTNKNNEFKIIKHNKVCNLERDYDPALYVIQ